MKKYMLLLICCLTLLKVSGQISVIAVPPGPIFTLDDLWQLTLTAKSFQHNSPSISVTIAVFGDAGDKIVSTTTKTFQFAKANTISINKFNLENYGPITTIYHDRSFKNKLSKQGGVFPSGNYKVDVTINMEGNGFTEPLGKYAYNINAAAMMPIQLVNVFNKDTIEEEFPMFTWIPPYPIPSGNITYEIVLNQILPNETRYTALTNSLPMLKSEIFNQNSFVYTPGSPKLQSGNSYAWQVNMFVDGKFYMGSDTWEFAYRILDSVDYLPEQYYVMAEKIPNNCVYIDSNVLPLTFIEDYYVLDSIIEISLFDSSGIKIADETSLPISYQTGNNYTFISFCPDVFVLNNGRYVLEVILANNRKYFIRFINNSAPGVCAY